MTQDCSMVFTHETKTDSVLHPPSESVLLFFRLLIATYLQDGVAGARRFSASVFGPFRQMRLALFSNKNSGLERQQDGKTVFSSKKGYIYTRAHTHAHGAPVSKKTVLRLAGPSPAMSSSAFLGAAK